MSCPGCPPGRGALARFRYCPGDGRRGSLCRGDRPEPEDVDAAAGQIGSGAEGLTADVTQLDSMEAMYAEVMRRHGRLDAVIANAGV
ncbi:MAG TPA: SDR family NAD(P)-dependent oxidoreductase [Streptosporangiaceae bacterium]